MKAADYAVINMDIGPATVSVLGAKNKWRPLEAEIKKAIPTFALRNIRKLEVYTLAAGYANTQYLAATKPPEPIKPLSDELTITKPLMLGDIGQLAQRNYLSLAPLSALRGTTGFENLAFDMLLVVGVLRKNWEKIGEHTGVTMEEIDRAENIANRLTRAIGFKEQNPTVVSAAATLRQQAFTLFFNAFDQVRRAVTYVRWEEDDVADFLPSLYAGRGGRGTPADTTTTATNPAATVTATGAASNPASTATATAAPVTNPLITPGPAPKPAPVPATAAVATTATTTGSTSGMPGDPPFNR